MNISTRVVDLAELENRLNGSVPAAYRAYVQTQSAAALATQGFDPKTLLILNLELGHLPRYDESDRRFFLSGDGCGNYHFVDLSGDPRKVLLWAHDPPGIEDPDCSLENFLRNSEQTNRIDWPIDRGSLWVCRTPTYADLCPKLSWLSQVGVIEPRRRGANAAVRGKIESLCRTQGLEPPMICTPEELLL